MAKKGRRRRRGLLSNAGQKARSVAGTAIQGTGAIVAVVPIINAAKQSNDAGGDIPAKIVGFATRARDAYVAGPDGLVAAIVGAIMIAVGSVVKRGKL